MERLFEALHTLNKANVLNQEYIAFIKKNPDSMPLISSVFNRINYLNIKSETFRRQIPDINNFNDIYFAFSKLNDFKLFDTKYAKLVLENKDPVLMAHTLNLLNEKGLLNDENIELLECHNYPHNMAEALCTLNQGKLLNDENIELIKQKPYPSNMANALNILNQNGLLNTENIKCINRYHDKEDMAEALNALNQNGLLNDQNRALIMRYPQSIKISGEINYLAKVNILNQQNIDKLLNPKYQILFRYGEIRSLICQIPKHLFSQAVFDQLIEYSQRPNPEQEIGDFVNRLKALNPNIRINHHQSVHNASIEKSVSDAAIRLYCRYGEEISGSKIDTIIDEIKDFVSSFPDDSQTYSAAKRCIHRITQPDFSYRDPTSQLTIRQLLALSYLALTDCKLCIADTEVAMQNFIEGLYEIQRGHNMLEDWIDNNKKEDDMICIPGTFNKLLDRVNRLHPDVQLNYITKELASLKLPKVVLEEAHKYLQERSSPQSSSDFLKFKCLIEDLQNNGVEVIWSEIEPEVRNRLFNEFGSLYNDKNCPNFNALIDAGIYTPLNDLSRYENDLMNSPGYQQNCSGSSQNLPHFFQNREDKTLHDTENQIKNGYKK